MNQVILVHGWASKEEYYDLDYPTGSNSHWFPWLSKQLIVKDIHAVALEMPNGYYPEYAVWKKELERFDIDENTVLVGHSCGGGFLVRWLCEQNTKVGKVILVAPWIGIDPKGPIDPTFFDFVLDENLIDKTKGLTIINSSNDMDRVQESVSQLHGQLRGTKKIELLDKGHFTLKSLGTEEFPELLEEIVGVEK